MTIIYHLHVNEISVEVINSIKASFKDKTVDMIVSDEVDKETVRIYANDDSLKFWMVEEEDIYQDYFKKNRK